MRWEVLRRVAVREPAGIRFEWRPEPGLDAFTSAAAARRALLCALDPALTGATDAHIKRHWDQQVRNVKHHKIQRKPS